MTLKECLRSCKYSKMRSWEIARWDVPEVETGISENDEKEKGQLQWRRSGKAGSEIAGNNFSWTEIEFGENQVALSRHEREQDTQLVTAEWIQWLGKSPMESLQLDLVVCFVVPFTFNRNGRNELFWQCHSWREPFWESSIFYVA